MKKLGVFLLGVAGLIAASMGAQNVYNYFSPGGALSGTATSQTVNLGAGAYITGSLPVTNLNNGTNASATTYWAGNGLWTTPPGSTGATPTGLVGTTAVAGSATTFLRSDGAPAINTAMNPTMTGDWVFTPGSGTPITINPTGSTTAMLVNGAAATAVKYATWQETGQTYWQWYSPASSNDLRLYNNAFGDVMGFGGDGGLYSTGQLDKGAGTLNMARLYAANIRVPAISSGTCQVTSTNVATTLLAGSSNIASCGSFGGGAGQVFFQFTFLNSYSFPPSCTISAYDPQGYGLFGYFENPPTTTSVTVGEYYNGGNFPAQNIGNQISIICSNLNL